MLLMQGYPAEQCKNRSAVTMGQCAVRMSCYCNDTVLCPTPEVHPAFGISCYVSGCDGFVCQQVTGSSLSGNMLKFQASVSGNGQRFSASQMRLWHSPCQRTPLGCNPVSHVSACWLTGLGLGTPSRYLARTISWNACELLLLLLLLPFCGMQSRMCCQQTQSHHSSGVSLMRKLLLSSWLQRRTSMRTECALLSRRCMAPRANPPKVCFESQLACVVCSIALLLKVP